MDELSALREMRAQAPEADADRLGPARERLMAAARTAPAGTATGRRRLRSGRPARPRSGGLGRIVPAGMIGLAAALALVAVQVAPTGPPGGDGAPATPAVAARYAETAVVLERAALVAESRPAAAAPRADQWQYRRYVTVQPNGDGEVQEHEEWLRYDGRQNAGYDLDGAFRVQDVPPDPGDDDLSPEKYAERLRRLPTDPDELLAHVTGDRHWIDLPKEDPGGAEPPDARAFRVLSVYLGQRAVMPPELEAAIYRALARIPGVAVELGVRDAAGRAGLGVFHRPAGEERERRYLILEPDTFRYLGSRTVWLRDEVIGGEVAFTAGSAYVTAELASTIVDRPGQRS
ncbi:CU044_5270 family protein [Planomonospora parontospora]|uniref:CU044_5270 family protein n=1 Tax=Planomonospora parontospora TaxID=58119 RepID=UPI001670E488|nr:CU044_5270 family protein [Planomonospora parontospora]GGL38833.1 hypothetical protein GCM10014719_44960 [Planomonospora parontospora subsp. antibiotica]GII17700.1 hypothetical protein Ppa05_44260 [Planomonospora parontospora subsp. antibiotica]